MIATNEGPTPRAGVDMEVFHRYSGISLPRHVSYPMPTWWREVGKEEAVEMHAAAAAQKPGHDLSLYLHVPFCERLCKFCACHRIILPKNATGAEDRVERYVAATEQEIRSLALSAGDRPLRQIHWGGGSPTYLSAEQIGRIHRAIAEVFDLAADAEVAMEVDPRGVTPDKLRGLRDVGLNRVSMGVQDFDDQTQQHVRRVQPFESVGEIVSACREIGFDSINFDLIYGMPYQTPDTIRHTIERTIELSPDRVAYYHYAQVPEKIATQRGMDYTRLPDSETKLEMFLIGLELFEAGGYRFIGLDHFAKSGEALARSSDDGTLQRNFQGMTTGGDLRLLAVGASSISHLPGVGFLQNIKEVEAYTACVERGESPIERGLPFSRDDLIRQSVISELYCTAEIHPRAVENRFDVKFSDYFSRELVAISELERDGLVSVAEDGVIRVGSPLGRVLIRNVAAVFDAYLHPDAYRVGEQLCFSVNA